MKLSEVVKSGANISVRTCKETKERIVEDDLYCTMESDGLVHFVQGERFRSYFDTVEGVKAPDYCECMEYDPIIKDWEEDRVYRLADYAKTCVPTDAFAIYAKVLDSSVKLFPKWDEDKYMLGMPGDYLVASADDLENVFVEPGDKFLERFEEI